MKNDDMNESAAALAEAAAPAPRREANPVNLARLLKQFDKLEKELADTTALREKLEGEINKALDSGSVDDDRLVASLATKRGKLELIPAKLARLEAERAALIDGLQGEFIACLVALEHRFKGMRESIKTKIVAFLQPVMLDDSLVESRVDALIMPYIKPSSKAAGLLNYIRFPSLQGNWAESARQWLRRENEANEIVAAAEAFAAKGE